MTETPTYSNRAHERRTRPDTPEVWSTRAQERVRHAIRAGKIEKPTTCPKCGVTDRQICSISHDPLRALETVEFMCILCLNKTRPRKKAKAYPPRFQNIRKLPDYETLKKLVVEDGLLYAEVAEIYGCNKTVVHRTLRDRAKKAGEYPLPIDRGAKIARANEKRRKTPEYHVLKRHCIDRPQGLGMTYAEVGAKFGLSKGQIHDALKAGAQARGEWPLPISKADRLRRARKMLAGSGDGDTIMAVMIHGLLEEHCEEREITLAQWAAENGFRGQYVYAIRAKLRANPKARMEKTHAVRVLAALGEDIPHHLRKYAA